MDVVVSQFWVYPEICIDIVRKLTQFLRVVGLQSKNGPNVFRTRSRSGTESPIKVGIMDNININISIFINITVINSDLYAAVLSKRPECGIIKPVSSDLYLAVGIPAVFVT
jgi:hypothetical protein